MERMTEKEKSALKSRGMIPAKDDTIDLHTHTIASGHAWNTMDEIVRTAAQRGGRIIGISDHAPAMEGSAFLQFFKEGIASARLRYGVRVLFGAELNILDYEGKVDLEEEYLEKLDYAIASLHVECIRPGTKQENTSAFLNAMKNPKVFMIGHPDDGNFEVDFDQLAAKACEHHVLIELNEVSVRPDSYRKNGRRNAIELLSACKHYGTQVIVSSDAHAASDVMRHTNAIQLLEELHFPEELIVNSSANRVMDLLSLRKDNS